MYTKLKMVIKLQLFENRTLNVSILKCRTQISDYVNKRIKIVYKYLSTLLRRNLKKVYST